MPGSINIAIIGCGSIGEAHAQCLTQIGGVRVTVYCDTNEQRARYLCDAHHGLYYTTDPERIFRDDAIDAVYICTHHDSHSMLAIGAAKAGKHIMLEKPMAMTIEDCRAIAEAVEKSGVKLMTAFKLRFYPTVVKVKEYIPRPLVTIAQLMDSRWHDRFWGNDPVKGGGNVFSQGCHAMDLVYYLNQSEPVRICAEGGNLSHPESGITDNIAASISFANGMIASVVIGDGGQSPFVSKFSFQVMDGNKSAHLYDRLKSLVMHDGEKIIEHHDDEEYGLMEENKAFIHALQNDVQPVTTYKDGLRATMMILKAFESIKTGVPQKIEM